jgi:hypothetical protein
MTDDALPALDVGDHVEDREQDDPATMLVVGLPVEPAGEYAFADGQTVAAANPDYPADDDVVQVIFPEETGVDVSHHSRYSYPRSRLRRTARVHDADTEGDA